MKFATVRLGKSSVNDIRSLASMPQGVVTDPVTIDVVCTQVPEDLSEGTVVFVWLGSDNSKGAPTDWTQGFKVVGLVSGIQRGAKYNDESTTTLSLKYAFKESITRLDVLRDCPEAYYWCSSLPIIGLDDHSNQTIRCVSTDSDRGEIGAFLYALNAVHGGFREESVTVIPELDALFWDNIKSPKTGEIIVSHKVMGLCSSRQLITYGAPGTGKSHKIDMCTNESNSIRMTFHPDTDYAAFVGAYKPTMDSTDKGLLTLDELKTVLQSLKDRGETRPEQKLGAEFWQSFEKLTPVEVKSILENESMYAEVMKGVAVGEYLTRIENGGKQIVYSFVPQAFMKAYVEAWRRYTNTGLQGDAKIYYLVIEEINRGNCAQIFGDLFQLLDRADNGFSAYAITPDDDIQKFLATDKDYKLADISLSEDIKKMTETGERVIATAADIKAGKKLVLPPNLCIWATMNTSDQSLFPMDSAFKRRWDWKYVPIKNANLGWEIVVGDCEVDWWKFLVAINKVVKGVTNSADKQLGYFFVKAKDSVVDAEMFVNKVAFYLWNDVFKDCELDGEAFKIEREGGEVDVLAFQDFFKEDGTINEEVLKNFLTKLVPQPETAPVESEAGPAVDGEA